MARHSALVLMALAAAAPAWAAGGHHAVDDAEMLEPGQCELQAWATREAAGGARLLHLEPSCRAGPVELSVGTEAGSGPGRTPANLQAKFARPVSARWQLGGSVTLERSDDPAARHAVVGLLLATWTNEPVAVHLNAGRQSTQHEGAAGRWGLGVDWHVTRRWTATAETWREPQATFARLGARFHVREDWSIDASRTRARHGQAPAAWTIGSTWQFGRQ